MIRKIGSSLLKIGDEKAIYTLLCSHLQDQILKVGDERILIKWKQALIATRLVELKVFPCQMFKKLLFKRTIRGLL